MAELILERSVRLEMRARAHHLQAGVLIGEKGLTEAVMKEIDRALADHGLVKIHVAGEDREERAQIYEKIVETLGAARIQSIGKMLVVYRPTEDDKTADAAAIASKAAAAAAAQTRVFAENGPAILMAKADPGARGMKKPAEPVKRKKAAPAAKTRGKSSKVRTSAARKRTRRTTKKAALS